MSNRNLFTILFCTLFFQGLHAQKQYWATTSSTPVQEPSSPVRFGGIVRVDSAAMHPELVLSFDTSFATSLGMPALSCGLMQASNGLIYFMTQQNQLPDHSRIIALDPVTDSAWVATELGTAAFPWKGQRSTSSMIEGIPGSLIEVTRGGGASPNAAVFRFDLVTNALSMLTLIPSGIGSDGYPAYPSVLGTLTKASNNKIYTGEAPWEMSVGKFAVIDPITASYTALLNSDPFTGFLFNGRMAQVGDKLYATTQFGGNTFVGWFEGQGLGTIGAYDLTTGTYQKLLDLDSSAFWTSRGLVIGPDDLLYAEAFGDRIFDPGSPSGFAGCLFAFDPATNTQVRKVNYATPPLGFSVTGQPFGNGLLSASNGKIYGAFRKGLFEYDPVADALRLRTPLQYLHNGQAYPYGLASPLIEICRKPNYKPTATTSFNVCAGGYFAYDLHNVNATNVVWRRNGSMVPGQSGQQLVFDAITAADSGVWTCTLTNECGVTEPPGITIAVNAGTFTTSTIGGDTLLCGYGDSAVLTGNNGGTWNTGATTVDLAATQPGTYYVINQNACGMSMSNLLHVSQMDSAPCAAHRILGELCPGVIWHPVYLPGIRDGDHPHG